jgi:lysophospholipase L1-like esterase
MASMTSSPTAFFLCAGDGLTEGTHGENYVERVGKALYQGWAGLEGEVVNAGRAGDTVKSLLTRIDEPLDRYQPQWVVLAVGGNDVWIPWLTHRSFGWLLWSRYRRIKLGQTPTTDLDRFAALYRALVDKVQQAGADALVCTTNPIGERISSPLNRQLARLNGVIKHVAVDRQVPVADVWQAFVHELAPLPKPRSYVPGEWLFTWLDRRRLRSTSPDRISQRRRLHLTFDGRHLNSRGADLWAYTIVSTLAHVQGVPTAPRAPANLLSAPPGADDAGGASDSSHRPESYG